MVPATPNIHFLSSVDTRKEEGLTLALLFLYVFIFFKIQILLLQEVTPAHAHAVMTASINAL